MKDGWYSRPVLFVDNVERAIAFYCDKLGFTTGWQHEEDGRVLVGEVSRGDCTLLLDCQQPDKTGRACLFISLDTGLIDGLRSEFEIRGASVRDGWWGYDTMIVEDLDGNELFFPYPSQAAD